MYLNRKAGFLFLFCLSCIEFGSGGATTEIKFKDGIYQKYIEEINSCLKHNGEDILSPKKAEKLIDSMKKENKGLLCSSTSIGTLEHPNVRRCKYSILDMETIEFCLKAAKSDNTIYKRAVVEKCEEIKRELVVLSEKEIKEKNLSSSPMYKWIQSSECGVGDELQPAGTGGG